MSVLDAVDLATRLVRCNTSAGNGEKPALEILEELLRAAGFFCEYSFYDADRANDASLIARLLPEAPGPSFFFGGHIDTVPFGEIPWDADPLSGKIAGGLLYGRGASDMKGGVAAMVCAASHMAPRLRDRGADLVIHIYGGEERGCLGSFHAARSPHLFGNPGVAVIAEPTGLRPLAGHKGALWLSLLAAGRTAHASMPERGDNALAVMIPAAQRLLAFSPSAVHPWLGKATCVLSSLHAGQNINSLPDKAVLTLDIRTVPGQDHGALAEQIASLAGSGLEMATLLDVPPVWTDPDTPWSVSVRRMLAGFLGEEPGAESVPFFTDAAALRSLFPRLPICILGPGFPAEAHTTNEHCPLEHIRTAGAVYQRILSAQAP